MTNTIFPGRPDYVGPTKGWFGLLHHDRLYEESHDVMERVAYVRANKPPTEVAVRLHNMIYLGDCPAVAKREALDAEYLAKLEALDAEYWAKRDALDDEWNAKRDSLCDEWQAKREALDAEYLAKRKPLDDEYLAKQDALDAEYLAKRDALDAEYEAKRDALDDEILAYIRSVMPDCAWDGEVLAFPKAEG